MNVVCLRSKTYRFLELAAKELPKIVPLVRFMCFIAALSIKIITVIVATTDIESKKKIFFRAWQRTSVASVKHEFRSLLSGPEMSSV